MAQAAQCLLEKDRALALSGGLGQGLCQRGRLAGKPILQQGREVGVGDLIGFQLKGNGRAPRTKFRLDVVTVQIELGDELIDVL